MTTFAKSLRVHPPAKSASTLHTSLASKSKSSHELRSKCLPISDDATGLASLATPPLPPPPPPPVMQAGTLESSGAQLQDLCPEDKARVARLIQQLVHVGNEHEKAVEEWSEERQAMEIRLQRLRDQNEALVKETAAVRSKFGATLTLVSQYQERLLEVRNARDVALAETIEAKKEAKDAFDRAEHAEESISALESKVQELESARASALSVPRARDGNTRHAERVQLNQIEARPSEPAANPSSVETTAAEKAAPASKRVETGFADDLLANSRRNSTASEHLSMQHFVDKEHKHNMDAAPLETVNVDSSLELDAPLLANVGDRSEAVSSPVNQEFRGPRSTRETPDFVADSRRSVEVEDDGVDADIRLLLSEQLPPDFVPDFVMRHRGTATRPPSGRALSREEHLPHASTPQSAAPTRPALAHTTNTQEVPRHETASCQEDDERRGADPSLSQCIAKDMTRIMGYGYGADLFDLLDELEHTPVRNS